MNLTTPPTLQQQTARKQIKILRHKLLDITNRNPLASFRHSERARGHVRVIDELPDLLLEKLVAGGKLTFIALPEPPDEPDDEKDDVFLMAVEAARATDENYLRAVESLGEEDLESATLARHERALKDRVREQLGLGPRPDVKAMSTAAWARTCGLDPRYDLPSPDHAGNYSEKHRDNDIQTLLVPDALDRKLAGLRELTRSMIQEMGVNALYCGFGFLEWYEDDASEIARYAPLLLYPLEIERSLKRSRYIYTISGTGEEMETNIVLSERLVRDFGVRLPHYNDDDTPETYFSKVETDIVAHKRRWRVRRWVTVGLFAFQRLAMYRDLEPERWGEGLEAQAILAAMLGGAEARADPLFAEEYNVDDPVVAQQVPLLITDADSSQFSAIVDVMGGRNLAIEGPPGTGKSQTITNIIAAAMATGQRVLFLAEKMAALDVVKSRLDQAGLGEFCLELHATKAKKKEVLEGLAARLKIQGSGREPARLEATQRELEALKTQLHRYVEVLNRPFRPGDRTIQQLLWAEQRTRALRPRLPASIEGVEIDAAETMDGFTVDRAKQVLAAVEQRDGEIRVHFGAPANHPWRGVRAGELTIFERQALITAFEACRTAVQVVVDVLDDLGRICGAALDELSLTACGAIADAIGALPDADLEIDDALFARLGDPTALEAVVVVHEALTRRDRVRMADPVAEDEEQLLECRPDIAELVRAARKLGVSEVPFAALEGRAAELKSEADRWRTLAPLARQIARVFDDASPTRRALTRYIEAAEVVATVDRRTLELRSPDLTAKPNREALTAARLPAQALRHRRERLRLAFTLEAAPSVAEVRTHADAVRNAGWITWFNKGFKSARRVHRRLSRRGRSDRATIQPDLVAIAEYLQALEKLESDEPLRQACGPHFAGLDTDFEGLLSAVNFVLEVRTRFPDHDQESQAVRRAMFEGRVADLEALVVTFRSPETAELREALARPGAPDELVLEGREASLRHAGQALASLPKAAAALGVFEQVRPSSLDAALERVEALRTLRRAVENNEAARLALGQYFQGVDTDRGLLARLIAQTRAVAQAQVPARVREHVFAGGQSRSLPDLKTCAKQLQAAVEQAASAFLETIIDGDRLDTREFSGVEDPLDMPARVLAARLAEAVQAGDSLAGWCTYVAAMDRARAAGLGSLLAAYDAVGAPYLHLCDAFDRAFHRTLVQHAFAHAPELRGLDGLSQTQARKRFQDLDRDILMLDRAALRARLAARPIDPGSSIGPPARHTGLRLVEREIQKQKRHIPIRELLGRAGRAIQDIKPCFMMSPLSVAQYLAPGQIGFDLLVIDEASQMRPEDALGALARAQQVVIVGDPKQLPPTSFFDRIDEPADDEDESADPESILGLALNTFRPARRLRWHYRSRHGSLIAFSNRRFYDNDLIVFPAPRELGGGFGVEYQRVAGTYEGRSNVVEAQAIADAAVAFMREHFDLSLGLVAINKTQAELITHEIDRLVARDRAAADYVQYWEGRLESFFVKNLETVQGDERDVIMISTVYGPDRNGAVHQRFGPINGELGWRRLNVLFTRAKNQLILFSSMDPNDIRVGPETRRGVKEFRAYLEYAATGRLDVGEVSSREPDSDFEVWVGERLSGHGYEVVPQVGVAGYFIDLAVRHPGNPNGFLLGIECDGASYHRAKSVRDRDRLRQEVLERLGWQLYRIWSTDWFNDPARELQKLVAHIEGLASRPDLSGSRQVIRLARGRSEETGGPSGERANEPSRHQSELRPRHLPGH